MSSEETSSLTVAKLKALCILNDLPTSGKKSELVERLLEFGLSKKEVGLPQQEVVEKITKSTPKEVFEEEIVLSLEDEDTLTPVVEKAIEKAVEQADTSPPEILDAEILDADFADDEPVLSKTSAKKTVQKTTKSEHTRENPTTLMDMIRKPQVAAVLLAVVILGAGGYYYLDNQLDSFTADQLRYGDRMQYQISGDQNGLATFVATEGFVELVMDQIDTEDDICKISAEFAGSGSLEITEGGSSELVNEGGSKDRLGAVRVVGGMAFS
jgi:hypothetical protein